jgi:hypothetical protein
MSDAVRKTLSTLFSEHSCAAVEADTQLISAAFFAASYDEVEQQPDFASEFSLVRKAKRTIELIARSHPAADGAQARQCLQLLKQKRNESRFRSVEYDVIRDLIGRTLHPTWDAVDRERFDRRVKVFDDWTDFFLSYTNRNAPGTNGRYSKLVKSELGKLDPKEKPDRNRVPEVIARLLEADNLRGFADYWAMQPGDVIGAEVRDHCRSTVAFVQVVEQFVLQQPAPPVINWCHEEYQAFTSAPLPSPSCALAGNRIFCVLSSEPPLIAPAGGLGPYRSWFDAIQARLQVRVDDHNTAPYDGLRRKIRSMAAEITATRAELVDAMLATWD